MKQNLIECLRCTKNENAQCVTCKYAVLYNGKFDYCNTALLEQDAADALEVMKQAIINAQGYRIGYAQAMADINTPAKVITPDWDSSQCPRCNQSFYDYEECMDGYYKRAVGLERCPFCGQTLEW